MSDIDARLEWLRPPQPMAYVGILWTLVPPEQRPPAWDVKPVGRHGSRVQRRRARAGDE